MTTDLRQRYSREEISAFFSYCQATDVRVTMTELDNFCEEMSDYLLIGDELNDQKNNSRT